MSKGKNKKHRKKQSWERALTRTVRKNFEQELPVRESNPMNRRYAVLSMRDWNDILEHLEQYPDLYNDLSEYGIDIRVIEVSKGGKLHDILEPAHAPEADW